MELNAQLEELVSEISPTQSQQDALKAAHIRLRERLMADETLKPIIVATFLQGSYRRHTAVRPEPGEKLDVDVVAVTRLNRKQYTPQQALNLLRPFLNRHYPGRWKFKGRSIGIAMSKVKLDLVLTSAPSQALDRYLREISAEEIDSGDWLLNNDRWQNEPLWIPDREAHNWQRTYPLAQIRWTHRKNRATNGHYIHVVKLVKGWWQNRHPEQKHPRSYPLEHIVGDCCPNGVTTLAAAFAKTLQNIESRYGPVGTWQSADRGVPEQNVLKRINDLDRKNFHGKVAAAARKARQAIRSADEAKSARLWQEVCGRRYPVRSSQRGLRPASNRAKSRRAGSLSYAGKAFDAGTARRH